MAHPRRQADPRRSRAAVRGRWQAHPPTLGFWLEHVSNVWRRHDRSMPSGPPTLHSRKMHIPACISEVKILRIDQSRIVSKARASSRLRQKCRTQVASILARDHLSASKRYARVGTIANAMDPSLPPRAAPRYLEARLGSRWPGPSGGRCRRLRVSIVTCGRPTHGDANSGRCEALTGHDFEGSAEGLGERGRTVASQCQR